MSRFTLKGRRGFTLIEIMIVVLIIAVLLAIAIPNFMKARDTSRTKACVANLRQIDTARMQWAMDAKLAAGAAVSWANLVPDYVKDSLYARLVASTPSATSTPIRSAPLPDTCSSLFVL